MNYRKSRVYSAPIPKMPPGLIELMEGLSKDVLKNNPINIYEFCADHMQKLLQIRDEKPSRNVLSLEEKIKTAQKIVRERAKQRRENYDKIIAQQVANVDCESSPQVDEKPTHAIREFLKVPEKEISESKVVHNEANSFVQIKEQNHEISVKSDVEQSILDSLNLNTSVEQFINGDEIVEKANKCEINKQPIDIDCEVKLHVEADILTNDKVSEKLNLVPQVEASSSVVTSALTENLENLSIGINKDEEAKTDEASSPVQETVDFSEEMILKQVMENDDESLQLLETNASLKNESDLNITKSEHSQLEQSNNVEICSQVPEKEDNIITDERKLPLGENEGNDSVNNGNHHNGMDLETAAITIQKVFRTFLFKSKTTSIDDATNVDINLFINDKDVKENINISNVNINAERRGISRMDTVLQTVNEEKSLSLSTDDSSTLSSAATIIQAHIRGFLVRNKLNINKTPSSSLLDSEGPSGTSMEMDSEEQKGKTILNIHIVPERGHFTSRDESLLTSVDLSLDGSPPSSANLHPHSYDINERRKQLKREDAVQSVSPPSNNSSSKLSEDVDSVRELLIAENELTKNMTSESKSQNINEEYSTNNEIQTAVEKEGNELSPQRSTEKLNMATDEMDVVTPFVEQSNSIDSDHVKLLNSSEFHEVVLPTKVSRNDTSVVREFHNVLAYFLLWN